MSENDEELNEVVSNIVKSLKPKIEEFLKMIDEYGYELDEDGDLVPKKNNTLSLKRNGESKYE